MICVKINTEQESISTKPKYNLTTNKASVLPIPPNFDYEPKHKYLETTHLNIWRWFYSITRKSCLKWKNLFTVPLSRQIWMYIQINKYKYKYEWICKYCVHVCIIMTCFSTFWDPEICHFHCSHFYFSIIWCWQEHNTQTVVHFMYRCA